MATDERAGAAQRAPPGFEMRIPQVPGMDHVRPYLEGYRDVGDPCGGGNSVLAKPAPGGARVVERRGEGMFGRQPVADRQRPQSRCPARLADHPAMAQDGTGAIAATMEEQENARAIAAANDRPFARHSIQIDRVELHVVGHRPDRADFVEALAPFGPADGSRL